MKDTDKIIKAVFVGIMALATESALITANNAQAAPAQSMEKCYGIVKAGKNDCATATSSCASSAKKDSQPDAFIFLPKGTCNKIVGGSLTKPASTEK